MRFIIAAFVVALSVSAGAKAPVTQREALGVVYRSLQASKPTQYQWYRYVWICPDTIEGDAVAAVDYAMNMALGTDVIVHGTRIRDNLLGYHIAAFNLKDFKRLLEVWDSMALEDPWFHVPNPHAVTLPPHFDSERFHDERFDVLIAEKTKADLPIVEARFLIEQLLDRKYYEFRGIKPGDDLHLLAARRGFSFEHPRGNFVLNSNVTGEQRVIAAYQGALTPTPATVTYDLFDETVDSDKQLIRNLDRFDTVSDGREVFLPLPNGLIEMILTDGKGKVVAEAPPNLAVDTTKPKGHDTRLRPALSCIACHTASDDTGMYRPFENDFEGLIESVKSRAVRERFTQKLDLADGPIGRARRDYRLALAELTEKTSEGGEDLHSSIVDLVYQYRYGLVDQDQAERELGFPLAEIPKPLIDDPEAILLLRGEELSRESWDAVRPLLSALHYSLVLQWGSISEIPAAVLKRPSATPLPSSNK